MSPVDSYGPQSLKRLLSDWQTAVSGTELLLPPPYEGPDLQVVNLVEHTGLVVPGSCFVARVRTTSDGHQYIPQAISAGAKVIVAQQTAVSLNLTLPPDVVYLTVADSNEANAWLAAAWYRFPSHEMVVVGITGTDGKTTTANILYTLLHQAGYQVGLLSTLRAVIGETEEPLALHVTTPEAPIVQQFLRRMVDAGVTHCVLETTSHALAQHRVTGVQYDMAIITNIVHEHLDYHGSLEAYVEAKATLFEMVANRGEQQTAVSPTIILNPDDPISYARLRQVNGARQLTYGLVSANLDMTATDITLAAGQTRFQLHLEDRTIPVSSQLFGLFNVYNMMAAAAAAAVLGVSDDQIQAGLAAVGIIYGRMHTISATLPFTVIVDFAHTPSSLENAIGAAREMLNRSGKNGRVITVFGSAGLRDKEKRTIMAQLSARDADLTILTAEDPRTESLADILESMAQGCQQAGGIEGENFWRIPDRGRAIQFALQQGQPHDILLICGKGHEQSMCFGTTEYPWDDVVATRQIIEAFQQGAPTPNLGLPTF